MHHQHDEITTDGLKVDRGVDTVQVEPHLDHVQPVHGLVLHVNARMPVYGKQYSKLKVDYLIKGGCVWVKVCRILEAC